MLQAISELWNGNIAPCEHCGAFDEKANRLVRLRATHRDMLIGELSDSQREIFQKYMDCSEDYLLRMMELAFHEGFCLGSNLTMESIVHGAET